VSEERTTVFDDSDADGPPPVSDALTPEEAAKRRADKGEVEMSLHPKIPGSRSSGSSRPKVAAGVQANLPLSVPAPADGEIALADPDLDSKLPSWTKHDLGFALQQLRSIREGVVRRTLRKLHIRWYHASLKRMRTLLEAAGVGSDVLSLLPTIIDTCDVCRNWQRVGARTVASARVPESFNQEVQVDLLFYKTHILLHCVDACIRWSAVAILPNKETHSILEGFATCWLRLYGPPTNVLSDREGGLANDLAAEWFEKKGIKLNLRAKEQHCGLVERHNEILRRQLHLVDNQVTLEGLPASFAMILAESIFAKNALYQCGNASPYEALFGRTPKLLTTITEETGEDVSDRDASRIRHVAISSMIQASASQKAKIANESKTRRSGELLELQLGDLVEFYRKPMAKDSCGWHGPAEVVNLASLKDGMLYVQWQGRVLAVRVQDVRRALLYASFLMRPAGPVRVLKAGVEIHLGQALRLGWMKQGSSWIECHANRDHSDVLAAGLYVSACCLHLQGVVGFRYGTSIGNLPAVSFDDTLLLWWNSHSSDLSEWYHVFVPGTRVLNIPKITSVENASVVQFLMIDPTEIEALRQVAPDIPHLGGTYDPDLPKITNKTNEFIRGQKVIADKFSDQRELQSEYEQETPKSTKPEPFPDLQEVQTSAYELENPQLYDDSSADQYAFDFLSLTSRLEYTGTAHESGCPHVYMSSGLDSVDCVDSDDIVEPPQFVIPQPMLQHFVPETSASHASLAKGQVFGFYVYFGRRFQCGNRKSEQHINQTRSTTACR